MNKSSLYSNPANRYTRWSRWISKPGGSTYVKYFSSVDEMMNEVLSDLRGGLNVRIDHTPGRYPIVAIQEQEEDKTMNNEQQQTADLLDFSKPLELPPGIVGKRVTESYNAFDCYICPNGHLQYNLTDAAKEEIRGRGVALPPICYEGAPCVLCAAAISPLETDVAILQNRVSNFMKMASRLKEQQPGLLAINSDANKIALYLRDAYEHEIEQGEPQHSGELSKAVVFYLKRERRRPSVVVGKVWRAMLRAMGV